MKKIALFVLVSLLCNGIAAQSCVTAPMSIHIEKEIKPAILQMVEGSIVFVDPNGNNAIDANEACKIRFAVENVGTGDGSNCVAKILAVGSTTGVSVSNKTLPLIKVGSTMTVELPINASMSTVDGKINFKVYVEEPMGFNTEELELAVDTRHFVSPLLRVVDHTVTGASGGVLAKNKAFDLQVLLQNVEQGQAENVDITIGLPENVYMLDGNTSEQFASMTAGETKSLVYKLIVPQKYEDTNIPIQIKVKERHGKYAENRTINLQLNQALAANKIEIESKAQEVKDIQIASLTSEVDKNIPVTNTQNTNTFAVIIANENYTSVASVPFALNDGNIFQEYCKKTLGIPAKNIRYVPNATLNQIKAQVNWLQDVTKAYANANIIFYYAGHGIPDESSRSSYLLPIDGTGTDVTTGYKLDDLYATLGNIPAKNVTVFMDACFSGSKRENGMLASARGVALVAKSGVPRGNMVVFSAAQGDETAYPNHEEKHGMFTYFLLKKLQETKGDVTLQELGSYITEKVSQESIVLNDKSQTPCVTASSSLDASWKTWKLK
ncbi:MAG: caspase family protein [Paludibacteraceae bacterium]|nr:caspase family protein [Paludibacteraceae bacterium]